jgi:CcmD family protein
MTAMYKFFLRICLFVSLLLSSVSGYSQDSLQKESPKMADLMRSNGKIYVVVTVLVIILAGLITYLVQLDRKISRLEKNNK